MTQAETTGARPHDRHREVSELLPWYVNGTLSPHEVTEVEAHLTTCTVCQHEFSRCRDIAAAVGGEEDDAWYPSPPHLTQMLARIDDLDARPSPHTSVERQPQGRHISWWSDLVKRFRWLELTPPPARWALAFQGALVFVLGGALLWQLTASRPELYRTLSSEAEPAAADRARLHLVFAEDITERELRTVLLPLQATIVHGPSPVGTYTVEIPRGQLQPVLERLRADPKVRLAEPVPSPSSLGQPPERAQGRGE